MWRDSVLALLVLALTTGPTGLAGRAGRLRRNSLLGLRTPSTTRSDAAWLAAHRFGGRWLVRAAGVSLAAAAVNLLVRPADGPLATALLAVPLAAAVALVVVAGLSGSAAARATRE